MTKISINDSNYTNKSTAEQLLSLERKLKVCERLLEKSTAENNRLKATNKCLRQENTNLKSEKHKLNSDLVKANDLIAEKDISIKHLESENKTLQDKLHKLVVIFCSKTEKNIMKFIITPKQEEELLKICPEAAEILDKFKQSIKEKTEKVDEDKPETRKRTPRGPAGEDTLIKAKVTKNIKVTIENPICPDCGSKMQQKDRLEKILLICKKVMEVVKLDKSRYICPNCGTIQTAKHSDELDCFKLSIETLVYIILENTVLAVPKYRMIKDFKYHGINISRQTLSQAVIKMSNYFDPFVKEIVNNNKDAKQIGVDETPIRVLVKDDSKGKNGYMWVVIYRDPNKKMAFYSYSPTRSEKHFLSILDNIDTKDGKVYIQCDGYKVYQTDRVLEQAIPVLCNAHSRRKFYNLDLKGAADENIFIYNVIQFYSALYAVEDYCKDMSNEERFEVRVNKSIPVLTKMLDYIKKNMKKFEGTPIEDSCNYAINNWSYLTNYLKNGALSIDNNEVERAIKPVALLRKNSLFLYNGTGGKSLAIYLTIIISATMNDLNVKDYLTHIIKEIVQKNNTDYLSLAPYSPEMKSRFSLSN